MNKLIDQGILPHFRLHLNLSQHPGGVNERLAIGFRETWMNGAINLLLWAAILIKEGISKLEQA